MKVLKIAHVTPEFAPAVSGVGQVVEELAKRQVANGHEVHVYTADWDKSKRIEKKEEVISGIKVHRCYHVLRIANFVSVWPSIFWKLGEEKFDVVHSHVFGHPHFVLSSIASKLNGAKHVHTTHCPWTDAHRSAAGRVGVLISYNFFSRIALKFVDKIIAITPWEYGFIKKFGGNQEKIINLPNGMDSEFFVRVKKNDFKKKLGIVDKKLVLYFGRLNVTKGPDKFVEIAKLILKSRKIDDVRFVVRGPDEGMREIVRKKIGNEKRIALMDEIRDRNEIIKMYQAADVFVLPSFREGLPLTLFEAMAAGLPIVASPVNGIPYEMKEPENGFLVKYGDNEGFAEKIEKFLDDSKLRAKVGKNNLRRARDYKWDGIYEKMMGVYGELLK